MAALASSFGRAGDQRHAIILAGGEGTRLQPFIRESLGSDKPKQFCSFWNNESLLEQTLRRVGAVVPPENITIVIGRGQSRYLDELELSRFPGRILEQCAQKGTGGAVFLALANTRFASPESMTLIVPSDHLVIPEHGFIRHLRRLFFLAERHPNRILLLGAKPDRAEPEFGYIQPGRPLHDSTDFVGNAWEVAGFLEKPSPFEAERLVGDGALWSTMVVASTVGALWSLGKNALPQAIQAFAQLRRRWSVQPASRRHGCGAEKRLLSHLSPFDFSRDVIGRSVGRSAVLPLEDVFWTDLGREDWLIEAVQLQRRTESRADKFFPA